MWRLENTAEHLPVDDPDGVGGASRSAASPEAVTGAELGDGALQLIDVAEAARQGWRAELAGLGGVSPLLEFEDSPRTRIDLTGSHPGGLARFITGKRTRLSNLVRESFAWRTAQIAAEAILQKSSELATARGIDALRLGVVFAEWELPDGEDTRRYGAPVLLRGLRMRRLGEDFELELRGGTELNPAFAAMLAERFGVALGPVAFPQLAETDGGFTPNAVIDRLRGLMAHVPGFKVSARLLVTTFAEVAGPMRADAARLAHPLLDAIAGNPAAVSTVREAKQPARVVPVDERSPQVDRLLLDADEEQERVIAEITAGNSLVVRTLPGTGGTQTVVNAVGSLVADGKRVLVVGPRRASLRAVRERLEAVGLPGLAATPMSARRDTVIAIRRAEQAPKPDVDEVDDALIRIRSVIRDYREALLRPDPVTGQTVLDCVSELSRLALAAPHATTTARLPAQVVHALAEPAERDRVVDLLLAAERFGEFRNGRGTSPWHGAHFQSAESATRAHELAVRLHSQGLPTLLEKGRALIEGTHMRPFTTVHELSTYVRLLLSLRDTLDKFQPSVFDRSITELIAATAPKREHPEFSGAERRRLRRLAEEYLRPGVRVPDLHEALVKIQKQRVLWHRYVAEGAVPRVPVGIGDCQVALQVVEQDLAELDGPLQRSAPERRLEHEPLDRLQGLLAGLAAEGESLQHLQERSEIMGQLHAAGIEPLVRDLAERGVATDAYADELELAWWASALAATLEAERALLGANTEVLDRLESDFRLVDVAHAQANAKRLAHQLAEEWRIGLVDWRDEAELLKRTLGRQRVTVGDLYRAAPHLSRTLSPVWLASPYEMPVIDQTVPFDTVILLDAGAVTVAEAALAIRRGRQVVAFGDPVTQSPAPFEIAVRDRRGAGAPETDQHETSAMTVLAGLLPGATLTRSYRAGGEDLAELVNRRFYGGRIVTQPWSGTLLRQPTLAAEILDSPQLEIARIVELAVQHARRRPAESLMVVTPSRDHATRVMTAVLAECARDQALAAFLGSAAGTDQAESFDVVALDHSVAVSRDRVIFSLGFGRGPHGRVLSDFGPLSGSAGDRLLASALASARRGLTLLSSVAAEELDESRVGPGVVQLRDVLVDIRRATEPVDRDADGDPMIVDLAARLALLGVHTRLGYRGQLPLVAWAGNRAAVVESDSDLLPLSLRESLRTRPELLKRLGWDYVRVHAFELFQVPDEVAARIAALLGVPEGAPAVPGPVRPEPRPRRTSYVAPASPATAVPPVPEPSEAEHVGAAIEPLEQLGERIVDSAADDDVAPEPGLPVAEPVEPAPGAAAAAPFSMSTSVEHAFVARGSTADIPTEPLMLPGFETPDAFEADAADDREPDRA